MNEDAIMMRNSNEIRPPHTLGTEDGIGVRDPHTLHNYFSTNVKSVFTMGKPHFRESANTE